MKGKYITPQILIAAKMGGIAVNENDSVVKLLCKKLSTTTQTPESSEKPVSYLL